jgi:hypothetical protein
MTGNHGADVGYRLHDPITGWHSHVHAALDGPDNIADGLHVHQHGHANEASHQHMHYVDTTDEDDSYVGTVDEYGHPVGAVTGSRDDDAGRYSPRVRAAVLNAQSQISHVYDGMPEMTGDLNRDLSAAEDWQEDVETRVHEILPAVEEAHARARAMPTNANIAEAGSLAVAQARLMSERQRATQLVSSMLTEWEHVASEMGIGGTGPLTRRSGEETIADMQRAGERRDRERHASPTRVVNVGGGEMGIGEMELRSGNERER